MLILLALIAVAAYVTGGYATVTEVFDLAPTQSLISADNSGAICVSGTTNTAKDDALSAYLATLDNAKAVQINSTLTVVTGSFAGRHVQIALRTQGDTTHVTAGTPYITTGY